MAIKREYTEITFSRLALALASDYESIYYLNISDDSYVEYSGRSTDNKLRILSSGDDFFADTLVNCRRLVYGEDQERFLLTFSKKNLLDTFEKHKVFTLDYRLVKNGEPVYYNLKTIRGTGYDDNFIIIGVRNVDEQMRKEAAAAKKSERYMQISMALASRYEVIYYINIEDNDRYIVYSSSDEYSELGVSTGGNDFFGIARRDIREFVHPDDRERMLAEFERERFLNSIAQSGSFSRSYRQRLGGSIKYLMMTAVRPNNDYSHVVIGVVNIDAEKRRENELHKAIDIANHDALTAVKNKHAYTQAENEINLRIFDGSVEDFAIAVFDVNGLKEINDTKGHIAGDEYIKSACAMICSVFKHSPVYRIGGDEFAVAISGEDLENREELMQKIRDMVRVNEKEGLVTIACGISLYDPDHDLSVGDVFSRADGAMYEDKRRFKKKAGDIK